MSCFPKPIFYFATLPSVAICAQVAYATHYMDINEAKQLIFPPTSEFLEIKSDLGGGTTAWKVLNAGATLGYLFIDNVIGKHEYITYAIGISTEGQIMQVEILDYRETKGGQIVNQEWRNQFKHKSVQDKFEVGTDIKNISGATLSCIHLTDGIKRIVSYFNTNLKELL